jgi:Circadian oscillating protein COP23
MKFLPVMSDRSKFLILLATAAMIGESALLSAPSQAVTAATSFVCGKSNGIPTTVARTKKGDVPIVVWSSEGFSKSGFTPQVRCQQVSARFQSLYRSGQLKYITAGTLNKVPVICATREQTGTCTQQNLLYTLKAGADPQLVIKKLMDVRNRATSRGLEESATTATPDTPVKSIEVNWLEGDESN